MGLALHPGLLALGIGDQLAGHLGELLGNCFWREGFEAAFGPDRMGKKGVFFALALQCRLN
ncbi:hypothetical protein OAG72_00450 [bacterium]|nr:hypothetical protein [bacterium]